MTKDELVTKIAQDSGISKKAAGQALNAVVGAIHDTLKRKEGSIRLAGLGTFKVVQRQSRNGINPQTKKKIKIPATKVPRFSASKALKEAVKKGK
jgi:nucleoid DNA-binding protein